MERYWFCICYENMRDVNGCIFEKIFDSFYAGTVPVYRGASNITDHIPSDCFIDLRDFGCYSELYDYLKSMSDSRYLEYLAAIERFLVSDSAFQFSSEFFAEATIACLQECLMLETRRA